jgi:Lon-like protease
VALVIAVVAGLAGSVVRLPYYSLGPGPASEVEPLIHISGHTVYPSSGKLIMTTVQFQQLTPFSAVYAWLSPSLSIVSKSTLFLPGQSAAQEQQRATSQMDQSKIDATTWVLSDLGISAHPSGALIESVTAGCPADGKLFAGDLIRSIDGKPIQDANQASQIIGSADAGSPIRFVVSAAGQTVQATLTKANCDPNVQRPLVGVSLVNAFPFNVSISSGNVGGPSAGLMWALGLYDLLTPGDLTGGKVISGTGEIDLNGKVFPIGGIQDKIRAAESAGAQIFLVPVQNLADARQVASSSLTLVPVANIQAAIDYLKSH